MGELLDYVDLLLAAPGLAAEARGAFPEAMSSTSKLSRQNSSRRTLRPEDEPPLSPGYCLDRSNAEVLTLRSPKGMVVTRLSTRGYVAASVERGAWEDYRQRNR